jgi:Putative lumazine-binding
MTRSRWTTALAVAALISAPAISAGQGAAKDAGQDKEAVRQAALDYLEGIYNVQPERIARSVHPTLNKRGFYKKDAASPYVESPMTYEALVKLASSWNKDGKRDTSVREIAILDILDQTAVVKLTAAWGIDYMFLGKFDGKWKITQILWQSHPPKT